MSKSKRGGTKGRIIRNTELKSTDKSGGVPKKLSKMEKWFQMRSEQIRKKRGW